MEKYSFPYSIFQCNVISTVLRQVTRDREGNRYETVQSGTNYKKRIFIRNFFWIFYTFLWLQCDWKAMTGNIELISLNCPLNILCQSAITNNLFDKFDIFALHGGEVSGVWWSQLIITTLDQDLLHSLIPWPTRPFS